MGYFLYDPETVGHVILFIVAIPILAVVGFFGKMFR
jgi:hypothetical protein